MKNFLINTYKIIQKCLMSDYVAPILFSVAILLWYFNLSHITILIMLSVVVLVLIFCNNVNNIFAPIIYVSFFIDDLAYTSNVPLYILAICFAVVSMIFFIVKNIITRKNELKKGNMFWAFIISTIAFMLGGCIGNFNLNVMLSLFAFGVITYILYWLAINCCNNLKNYLFKLSIYGAIAISVMIIISNSLSGDFIGTTVYDRNLWVGAQNINVAAVFLSLGVISCFGLGFRTKYDFLYYALATALMLMLLFTYCRVMIAITIVMFIPMLIISIIKSPRKLNYLWPTIVIVFAGVTIFIIFKQQIFDIFHLLMLKTKTGANGRDILWPWCIEKFKEYPIFGYGFISKEYVPTIRNVINLILAHNTILQWLTSLGIVGSVLLIYFYYKKYQITFSKFSWNKLFLVFAIVTIALSGMVDQSATMDFFVVTYIYLLISSCEQENALVPPKPKKIKNTTKKIKE